MKKNPIIFLDFDGVVNTIYYRYYPKDKKYSLRFGYAEDGFVNNEQAIAWLNELYKKFHYDIVITSTWRFSCDYKNILYNSGLNSKIKILGATPRLSDGIRGDEITQWIIDNNEQDRNIIILDDDEDMGILKNNLIKCDPYLGFTLHEYTECVKKFNNWGYPEYA